ncbi:MAG: nucleotidyltransferase family protein [Pseudomonadota bacterium]
MAVLAAGSSRRFGDQDKLAQPFRGKRLGERICEAAPMDRLAPGGAVVIASRADHPCRPAWEKAGFEIAVNTRADRGMGTSVALAADLAQQAKSDALLIALADMPMVPISHLTALIDACHASDDNVCSSDGHRRTPPAIFGRDHFSTLAALSEDVGARPLLQRARTIACPPGWLIDIDTPEALRRLSQR